MRDIKFKVWDKARKVMLDDVRLSGMLNKKLQCKSAEFLQYTGLKDKNGVEMYCGDIVTTDDGIYIVKYIAPSLSLVNANDEYYNSGDFYTGSFSDTFEWGVFEIIGNIYENPELLEQSK